jgi:HPr kinase/phosphorylase
MIIGDREIRHSTCVSVDGVGILIIGPSGSGKSTLAMKLIALGAFLVGDDRCLLLGNKSGITVERPPNLPVGIEARGIGILRAPMTDNARLGLVVDLGQKETERLPEQRTTNIMGHDIPLFYDCKLDAFAQSLYILARYGIVKNL